MRHNSDDFGDEQIVHEPVLVEEILSYMAADLSDKRVTLVDCTLGEGGHSELLLKKFNCLHIIGFERDSDILQVAKKRLSPFEDRIEFINDNFSEIDRHLERMGASVDYILYDFGISSFHFDKSGRGFAFKTDEPLDMRLDDNAEVDASYIVNNYTEKELEEIIKNYGEENWARKIAKTICESRKENPLRTTSELAELVLKTIPKRFHVKNIHPATRVFQALRIAVNNELESIQKTLDSSYKFLVPGGRIMAISFHSLEDRIVKNTFRRLSRGCTCKEEPINCVCNSDPYIKILTKKPVVPGEAEISANSRARSAKLRVCERL